MIIVTYQQLPPKVPALVHANPDDSYTIIVNKDLSDSDRRKALWHEVRHINGGDLYEDSDVNALEAACHGGEEDFQIGEDMEIYVKDGE